MIYFIKLILLSFNSVFKKKKKVYFLSPVRSTTPEITKIMEEYVKDLENQGYEVYWPMRDTVQTDTNGFNICMQNFKGMKDATEIHTYFQESQGILFDFGIIFTLNKPLKIINTVSKTATKSFTNVVITYAERNPV
ncbi:MAG: hypothetical protein WC783_00285 [Candidatus Paceibacterota bacterium]|jgi:hypothetical protein